MSRLSGHSIGQESSPKNGGADSSTRSPASSDVGVGHPDHEVARGVAAAGVDQLDRAVAEVEDPDRGERVVGRHDLGLEHLVGVRVVRVVARNAA